MLTVGDDDTVASRTWLLNPGEPIPDEAAAIHGITTEKAQAESMDHAAGLTEIRDALTACWTHGRAMVAYNAAYDITVIASELHRLGLPPLEAGLLVDPLVIDRARDPERRGSRKLVNTIAHYRLTMGEAHTVSRPAEY